MPRLCSSLLLSLLIACAVSTSASAVSISLWGLHSAASALAGITGDYEIITDLFDPLPDSGTVTATSANGLNECVINYNLSDDGFTFTFEHARDSAEESFSQSSVLVRFTPNVSVGYVLTGAITAYDPGGRVTNISARLADTTPQAELFFADHVSYSTANEAFTLGQSGGDVTNKEAGSLTGTLVAGHQYTLSAATFIGAYHPAAPSPASAIGHVTLAFVPEPGTGVLVIAGLLGLAGWRRERN